MYQFKAALQHARLLTPGAYIFGMMEQNGLIHFRRFRKIGELWRSRRWGRGEIETTVVNFGNGHLMTRASLALSAALAALFVTPLAAQPLSRSCDYKGEGKLGPLRVDFDEATRSVQVTTHDGQVWRYKDGVTGRISPTSTKDDLGPVEQFVKLGPDRVEVGFRWPDDGTTGHLAYFDPTSFTNLNKPCLWRSLWDFATG